MLKRAAIWLFYAVGVLAVVYLALYAWAMFSGPRIVPGDPIRIFRKPDAPDYSVIRGVGHCEKPGLAGRVCASS